MFFIVMATGSFFAPHPFQAEQYHALAKAALSIEPIHKDATTITVQALFALMRYVYVLDRGSNEYRWLLGGMITRISQAIGLRGWTYIALFGFEGADIRFQNETADRGISTEMKSNEGGCSFGSTTPMMHGP
jgi:hypothetical protein